MNLTKSGCCLFVLFLLLVDWFFDISLFSIPVFSITVVKAHSRHSFLFAHPLCINNARQSKFHSENSGLSLCPQKWSWQWTSLFYMTKLDSKSGIYIILRLQSGQNASHQNSEHSTYWAQEDCLVLIPAPVAAQEFYLMPVVTINARARIFSPSLQFSF